MSVNGQTDGVLRWPGRVVAVEELRRRLNGHRELVLPPRAVVTPSALDELRTQGIYIRQEEEKAAAPVKPLWGYGQDRAHPMVQSAARAVQRDGVALRELPAADRTPAPGWARAVAECVAGGGCVGGVLFCENPALVCCVANKVAGLRAAAVATIGQAAQALLTIAPNLVVVEMPGRTFFEIRQILRTFCQAGLPRCPDGAACTLQELDGHAHR
jgi:hypothetical protein